MSNDVFENWININITMSASEICQDVADNNSKLSANNETNIFTEKVSR